MYQPVSEAELTRRLAIIRANGGDVARLLDANVQDGLLDARLSRRIEAAL